jgi:hypothetical protein
MAIGWSADMTRLIPKFVYVIFGKQKGRRGYPTGLGETVTELLID